MAQESIIQDNVDVDAMIDHLFQQQDAIVQGECQQDAEAEKGKQPREEVLGVGKQREGIEWRENWEPTTELPSAIDKGTAEEESLQLALKSKAAESFRRQQLIKDYASLPEQEITPEVKRQFRLLRLRGVMNPKRFYKGIDEKKLPKRFQWGTVVEGPTDYYSSRLTKKERKSDFTQEILHDEEIKTYRKRKFREIQDEAQKNSRRSGKYSQRKPRKKSLHKGYKG